MKTEQTLMCVLFVMCAVAVFATLATMLSMPIEPMSIAHSVAKHLPAAVSSAG